MARPAAEGSSYASPFVDAATRNGKGLAKPLMTFRGCCAELRALRPGRPPLLLRAGAPGSWAPAEEMATEEGGALCRASEFASSGADRARCSLLARILAASAAPLSGPPPREPGDVVFLAEDFELRWDGVARTLHVSKGGSRSASLRLGAPPGSDAAGGSLLRKLSTASGRDDGLQGVLRLGGGAFEARLRLRTCLSPQAAKTQTQLRLDLPRMDVGVHGEAPRRLREKELDQALDETYGALEDRSRWGAYEALTQTPLNKAYFDWIAFARPDGFARVRRGTPTSLVTRDGIVSTQPFEDVPTDGDGDEQGAPSLLTVRTPWLQKARRFGPSRATWTSRSPETKQAAGSTGGRSGNGLGALLVHAHRAVARGRSSFIPSTALRPSGDASLPRSS